MEVNGLTLPHAFTTTIAKSIFPYDIGLLAQLNGLDPYGHRVSLHLGDVYQNCNDLVVAQEDLPIGFEVSDIGYGNRSAPIDIPGAIPDITDFSRIVCFASSGSGALYCFDFRDTIMHPSIIHWDDGEGYWRRIAPDFNSFLAIFGLAV